jgi:hypothetical protein
MTSRYLISMPPLWLALGGLALVQADNDNDSNNNNNNNNNTDPVDILGQFDGIGPFLSVSFLSFLPFI